MTSPSGKQLALNYPFAPVPIWLLDAWEASALSDEALHLQLVLFRRANSRLLADRLPTPRLRLDSLAAMLGRPTDGTSLQTLGHFLRLERRRGRLDYTTEGNQHTGIVYVLTLYPDGPRDRSAVGPRSGREGGPRSEAVETGPGNGITAAPAPGRSAQETATFDEGGPREGVAGPRSPGAANLGGKPVSASAAETSGPRSLDVQDNPKPSGDEDSQGRTSSWDQEAEGESTDGGSPLSEAQMAELGTMPYAELVRRFAEVEV